MPETVNKNEEVDLLDLFGRMARWIGRLLKSIGNALLVSIIFLVKNYLPLSLSIIAGIGIGFLCKYTFSPTYRGDFVLKTNAVKPAELIAFTNKMHLFCDQKNYQALSSSLSISNESAEKIIDIGAFWVIDRNSDQIPDYVDYRNKLNVYDTLDTRMADRVDIRVKTRSPQLFIPLRTGIMKLINNDSLFKRLNSVRISQNKELKQRLDYDIRQLDSLQKVKYFEETRNNVPKSGGQIVFLQEQKTQLVYTDIYTLYARKQNIESEEMLYGDVVTLLSDIAPSIKSYTGGLFYSEIFVPVFFGLTLLILIILRTRSSIKELFSRY